MQESLKNLCFALGFHLRRLFSLAESPGFQFRKPENPIKRIVFLCKGNICRSPYAAQKLQRLLSDSHRTDISIQSAGLDTTPGKPADPQAKLSALERGIDLSSHLTTRAESSMLADADLVIIMDRAHWNELQRLYQQILPKTLYLGFLSPSLIEGPIISDPFGLPPERFRRCYARIDLCLAKLVRDLL